MYSPSSSRSLIRSACSVVVLLGAAALGGRGAAAQQPDEALVSELARVLAAADARAFDPALFGEALRHPEPVVRRQAALAAGRIGDPAAVDALVEALGDSNQGLAAAAAFGLGLRSEEHTSELQSLRHLVCRLLLEKKKQREHHIQRHSRQT